MTENAACQIQKVHSTLVHQFMPTEILNPLRHVLQHVEICSMGSRPTLGQVQAAPDDDLSKHSEVRGLYS